MPLLQQFFQKSKKDLAIDCYKIFCYNSKVKSIFGGFMLYCESIDEKEKNEENAQVKEKEKKKPRIVRCICIVAAVLLLVAGAFFFFGDYILNGFFSICSPEMHFKYICIKNGIDIYEDSSEYGAVLAERTLENKTLSGKAEVYLETAGVIDTLADSLGFKKTPLIAEYAITKNKTANALDIELSYGKKHVLSLEARADYRAGEATVCIPELSKKALLYKVEQLKDKNLPDSQTLKDVLPEDKLSSKLILRYFLTAASCIDDVEREKQELIVGDEAQNKTRLRLRVSTDTLLDIGESVLEKALDDKDLKKHIINNEKAVKKFIKETFPNLYDEYKPLSAEELYERLYSDAKKALEGIKKARKALPDAEYFALSLWINEKGEIAAIDAQVLKNAGLYIASLESNSERFTEAILYMGEKTVVSVEGESSIDKDILDGSFDLMIGDRNLTFEYSNVDKNELKKGNIGGNIKIADKKTRISCDLNYSSDKNGSDVEGSIGYRTSVEFKVSAESEKIKARKVSLHEECIDFSAWKDVFSKERFEILLKKTGLLKISSLIGGLVD